MKTIDKLKDQILAEEKSIKEKKEIKLEIKNRWTGDVVFSSTKTTMREAVEEAVKEHANLEGANLKHANLEHADLKHADLKHADLKGADTKCCTVNFTAGEYEQAKQFIEGLRN